MNARSIRFRLVFWYAGILLTAFLFLGSFMYAGLKAHRWETTHRQRAKPPGAGQIIEALMVKIDTQGEPQVVNELGSWFSSEANGNTDRFVRITRGKRQPAFPHRTSQGPQFQTPPMCHRKTRDMPYQTSWHRQKVPPDNELLIASVPYTTPQGRQYMIEVGTSTQLIIQVLHRLITLLTCALPSTSPLSSQANCYLS